MRQADVPLDALGRLRAEYQKWFEALVEKHPAQAQNLPHYRHLRDSARLGVMARNVKGTLSSYRKGDQVLVWGGQNDAELREHLRHVWHPRNDIGTVVRQGDLKEGW